MRSLLFAATLCLCACSTATTAPEAPTSSATRLPDRDPALAKRMIEDEGGILLDVRTPQEFEEGHIEGAVNLSHDTIESQLSVLETLTGGDKSKPIVTYCGSGKRAGKARETLEAAGYTNVTNVGGMTDYPAQ